MFSFYEKYTTNVNEFVYLFRFMYPRYVQKLYDRKNKGATGAKPEDICREGKGLIDLFNGSFKSHMAEI